MTRGFVISASLRFFQRSVGGVEAVCRAAKLPPPNEIKDHDLIPAEKYYDVLNRMVEASGDKFFAARAGISIALEGLPALVGAKQQSTTLGEFLHRLQLIFHDRITNARYELHSDGGIVHFGLTRDVKPKTSAVNVDALNAAGLVTLISEDVGDEVLSDITIAIADPSRIPKDVLPKAQVVRNDGEPMKVMFPAKWLLQPSKLKWETPAKLPSKLPEKSKGRLTLGVIEDQIDAMILQGDASLRNVASELGVSHRRLQRMLADRNLSFRKLVREKRLRIVCDKLRLTQASIETIAEHCGFSSASSLSKSFQAMLGMTPTAYRMTERAEQETESSER